MLRGGGEKEKGGTRETERHTHVCASTVRGSKESERPSGGCQRRGEGTGLHTEDGPLITAQGERKGEGRKLTSSHLTDETCPSKAARRERGLGLRAKPARAVKSETAEEREVDR